MTLHGLIATFLLITSRVRKRRGPLARVHPWTQFPTSPIMGVPFYSVSVAGTEMLNNSSDISYPFVHDSATFSSPKLTCPNSLSKFRICDIFDLRQVNNFLQVYCKLSARFTQILSFRIIVLLLLYLYSSIHGRKILILLLLVWKDKGQGQVARTSYYVELYNTHGKMRVNWDMSIEMITLLCWETTLISAAWYAWWNLIYLVSTWLNWGEGIKARGAVADRGSGMYMGTQVWNSL